MRLLLVAVLLGAGLVAWFVVRRRGTGLGGLGGRDQLQVIGTTRVGGRFLVALVRVPGRTLVVGASDKGLSLLSEIRDAGDDQLEALPDGVVRDAQGLLGAAPEAPRGLGDGGARGRGGAPFDNLLSEMLRGGQGAGYGPSVGAAPGGAEPGPRGGQSPLESPEARALRARLQRQQPSP
jgi:flagellar biogenesis protein FliO